MPEVIDYLNLCQCFPLQDENRYSATKGAHLNLKRAEKARIMVAKLPCKIYPFYYS